VYARAMVDDFRAPELLQQSSWGAVVLEPGGATVAKTFFGAPQPLLWTLARREFERLERFSAALQDVEGAACPRPMELVGASTPKIRMERASGIPLPTLLGERPLAAETHHRLVTTVIRALDVYVELLAEPYYDLHFGNMLYDPLSRTLTFLDFGFPEGSVSAPPVSPHDASLGNLIGSTIFESARPKWLRHQRQHRQSSLLCAAIVESFVDAGHPGVTRTGLWEASRAAYERSAFPGAWSRRVWYGSVGYLLARRITVADIVFSPSPRPLRFHGGSRRQTRVGRA
jgi:hypothetical protein